MIMIEYDNYLAHYGVEGMKWGVRKNRSSRTQKLYDRAVALSNQVSQSAQTGDHVSRFQKRYMRQIDSVQRLAQNNNSALVKKNKCWSVCNTECIAAITANAHGCCKGI